MNKDNIDYKNINIDSLSSRDLDSLIVDLEACEQLTVYDYKPHPKQLKFHQSPKKVRCIFGGNRSGKTVGGTLEAVMHATGEYPKWYPLDKRIDRANRGRIIVTDYAKGCGEVLAPKLEEWLPKDRIIRIKKSPQGGYPQKYFIKHKDGGTSTFDILTHEQDDQTFEGWDGDWAWFDEPPPRNKYVATMRGLVDRNGRAWLTLTPLEEPWLYDELVAKDSNRVFYINVDIRDNPHLSKEAVADFEATLTEDEKEARLRGKFRHLVGRIYKEIEEEVHFIPEGKVKLAGYWTTYFVLDPHDRRPMCGIWAKVDPMGNIYVFQELFFQGTVKAVAKQIMLREIEMKINPTEVIRILDPNKGRTPSNVTGLRLDQEFAKWAVYFITNVNDNVALGHLAVKEKLGYDKTEPISTTNKPKLYFIIEGTPNCRKQFLTYVWDEWRTSEKSQKEKPKDVNKDFPDCVRYLCMFNPHFIAPDNDSTVERRSSGFTGWGE